MGRFAGGGSGSSGGSGGGSSGGGSGGSGGNGMVTLENSVGNEFSHEVGHNYGLGHYVDGFRGSVHRPASEVNSSWGWDSEKNVFYPNFSQGNNGLDQCLDGECQSPYLGKYQL